MQLDLPSTAEIDALPADPTICFPVALLPPKNPGVALLPPKGRPSKNPGKRLHSSREDGTKVKKPRRCGLCKAHNHTKANCPFKQLFDTTNTNATTGASDAMLELSDESENEN
eukprot:CAMPEP_0197303268 /NCGR_PEP_ID=MMETSP0890-20130614/51553_1 /TAXON_ID=44058 ORGANISM="Aureoumbra lagunensis, Strain CCMP1510" /NCGR_SAMPLE_ID=MMETSP0890 /ASSEMBLY_ACC=CAM_ASM_000533 /LENGTH=112 /DNA_ID=CAMNT_0042783055 /DNA_START=1873 /DNA_END=2211 /DNA_ORIENTATION=+